jgi:hypothetical protein
LIGDRVHRPTTSDNAEGPAGSTAVLHGGRDGLLGDPGEPGTRTASMARPTWALVTAHPEGELARGDVLGATGLGHGVERGPDDVGVELASYQDSIPVFDSDPLNSAACPSSVATTDRHRYRRRC